VGWIAIALFSVSPFYIAYAQEARPYSLWTVTILLSGATLLRAIRRNNRKSWFFYAVTLIFGFYTSLLSFLVAFGQGVYVIALENFHSTRTVRNYLIALGISLVAFSPWLIVILAHFQALQENTTWMRSPVNFSFIAAIWVASVLLIFGDLPLPNSLELIKIIEILITLVSITIFIALIYLLFLKSRASKQARLCIYTFAISTPFILISTIFISSNYLPVYDPIETVAFIGIIIAFGLLILTFFAIFFVFSKTAKFIKLFILIQTLSNPLLLVLNDLISKGQIAGAPRYLIPLLLGIQVSVAYLLTSKINASKSGQQQVWKVATVMLISVGVISGILNLEKSPIYQKSRNFHNLPIARILNHARKPILLVDSAQTIDILSLSNNLEEKVKIMILSDPGNFAKFIDDCQEIFLFNPSETLRSQLTDEAHIPIEQVYKPKRLIPGETVLSLWSVKNIEMRSPKR